MADEKTWTKEKIKSRIDDIELDLSLCGISKVPVKNMIWKFIINFHTERASLSILSMHKDTPSVMIMLTFTKVTILDLSCNKINILPDNFCKLINLTQLDLSKNSLTALPEIFGDLVRLKKLDLLQNHLSTLPISIRNLKQLQWLDLKENPIQEEIPQVVGDCLKAKECNECAKNIVQYYEGIYNEQMEKERKAKKREEARAVKEKREEDALRQRKRQERKKKLEEKIQNNEINDEKKEKRDLGTGHHEKSKRLQTDNHTTSCYRILLYVLFFLMINMIILALVFKGDLQTITSQVEQTLHHWKSAVEQTIKNYK